MARATASTRVFAVGISQYRSVSLRLEYGAKTAAELVAAFTSERGCGILRHNIESLSDEEAASGQILARLNAFSKGSSSGDVLIVYFSGHGERVQGQLYLLGVDADPTNVAATSISAQSLRDALIDCPCRGILIILDCCNSAGFAEALDGFVSKLKDRDFLLLLCASREGQSSLEFAEAKGTFFSRHLIDVVHGRITIGSKRGVVYFSALYDSLIRAVGEGLERSGLDRRLQEPVFAGTYSGDPLLFIPRDSTIQAIENSSPLYSRSFLYDRIRRALLTATAILLAAVGAYYFYLDHNRYVGDVSAVVNGFRNHYIAIYSGDPTLNALGFPHITEVTDIPTEALPVSKRPGPGRKVASRYLGDAASLLAPDLPPEWGALLLQWQGQAAQSIALAKTAIDDTGDMDTGSDNPTYGRLIDAYYYEPAQQGLSSLAESATNNPALEYRSVAALRLMANRAPDHAIDIAGDGYDGDTLAEIAILQGLRAPCDDHIREFLVASLSRDFMQNRGASFVTGFDDPASRRRLVGRAAWFAALMLSRCVLPDDQVINLFDKDTHSDLMPDRTDLKTLALTSFHPSVRVLQWLSDDLAALTRIISNTPSSNARTQYTNESLRALLEIRILALVDPIYVPSDVRNLLKLKAIPALRYGAASALIARRPQEISSFATLSDSDPWILCAMLNNGWFDHARIEHSVQSALDEGDLDGLVFVLYTIRRLRLVSATDVVATIEQAASYVDIKVAAAETLDSLEPSVDSATVSMRERYFITPPAKQLPWLDASYSADGAKSIGIICTAFDDYRFAVFSDDRQFDNFMSALSSIGEKAAYILGRLPLSRIAIHDLTRRLTWISHTSGVTARRYPAFASIINVLQEAGPRPE